MRSRLPELTTNHILPQMKKALMNNLITAYQNLHLLGYYRGGVSVPTIKSGFKAVNTLIEMVESKI